MESTGLFALLSVFFLVENCDGVNKPVLIVLSLDSLNYKHLGQRIAPNMEQFKQRGSYAKSMKPQFPTKTLPNHHSLATGCTCGSHGVTSNKLYDMKRGVTIGYSYGLFHYNDKCRPVYTINQYSGCMMWPGSDFSYNGRRCTHYQKMDKNMTWKQRLFKVISWIKDKTRPANLIMWYMEQPDANGHAYSPSSYEYKKMIGKVDELVGHITRTISAQGLGDRVNIIILSDHGMTSVKISDVIDLSKILKQGTWRSVGTSPQIQIIPAPGKFDEVYTKLKFEERNKPFKVYKTRDVPKRWKLDNERRVGPILAVANSPYAFEDLNRLAKWQEKTLGVPIRPDSVYGVHGYDNKDEDMQAIFMAKGPLIRSGQVLDSFENIDVYMLICTILQINCPPSEGDNRKETWNKLLYTGVQQAHRWYRGGNYVDKNQRVRNNVGRTPYNRNFYYQN